MYIVTDNSKLRYLHFPKNAKTFKFKNVTNY